MQKLIVVVNVEFRVKHLVESKIFFIGTLIPLNMIVNLCLGSSRLAIYALTIIYSEIFRKYMGRKCRCVTQNSKKENVYQT